ncbi:MAG: flavoprotein [Gemmataceae bacterium]
MANVLLGVTGSVATVKAPELVQELKRRGHAVRVVATRAATFFFDPAAIAPKSDGGRDPAVVTLDEDEWAGHGDGQRYQRGGEVPHIELRRWAELLLIAPLDANTLAKLAVGLCDNCLTCVWRAWEPKRPVVLAPAMNTVMWEHPFTRRHLRSLAADAGAGHLPGHLDQDQLLPLLNDRSPTLHVVPPISKALACGDVGVGAMAALADIAAAVDRMLPRAAATSPLSAPPE